MTQQRSRCDLSFRAVFDALTDHVAVLDAGGRVVATNRALKGFGAALGLPAQVGSLYMDAFRRLYDGASDEAAALDEGVRAVLKGELPSFRLEHACHAPRPRWFSVSVTPLPGPQRGAVVQHRNITESKEREEAIYTLAHHDALTGLMNRRHFSNEAEKLLVLSHRSRLMSALIYLDLDGFKAVNDTHGHAAGDLLLRAVAARLRAHARQSDLLARFGGDEFVIFLFNSSEAQSLTTATRYQNSLLQPFKVRGRALNVRGSFGLAHFPQNGETVDELLSHADEAMYAAKALGGGIHFYPPTPRLFRDVSSSS